MSRLLVLHATGEAAGGRPWAEAFEGLGVDAAAPDLAGHAGAEPSVGRCYQLPEAAVTAARWFAAHEERVDTLVGVGSSGWGAQVAALGGRCDRLVLVDGLGGPFESIADLAVARRAMMRELVVSGVEPVVGGLDPRTAFAPPGLQDLPLALDAADHMAVPVLVIETDASRTSVSDAQAIAERFGVAVLRLDQPIPSAVAAAIQDWRSGCG